MSYNCEPTIIRAGIQCPPAEFSDYLDDPFLDEGAEAEVYQGPDDTVIKRYHTMLHANRDVFVEHATRECRLAKDYDIAPEQHGAWFCEDTNEGYIQQPKMGGTLGDLIKTEFTKADGETLLRLINKIAANGYVMRDFNPGNVMYSDVSSNKRIWHLVDTGMGFSTTDSCSDAVQEMISMALHHLELFSERLLEVRCRSNRILNHDGR